MPAQSFHTRKIDEFLHYAPLTGLNCAVLHVKDPRGRIYWKSTHPAAKNIKAYKEGTSVKYLVSRLKNNGIWVIAKMDAAGTYPYSQERFMTSTGLAVFVFSPWLYIPPYIVYNTYPCHEKLKIKI